MKKDNTRRFSDRVADYVKYRPSYPVEIIEHLRQNFHLDNSDIIVDVGSGTGISAEIFLKEGFTVIAVEPNKEMREEGERTLRGYSGYSSVAGTAEATTLPDHTADFIIAAQAFHWFDKRTSRDSFKKLLRKDGIVVLIWNERLTNSPFEKEYDQLIIKHAIDYTRVNHRNIERKDIDAFYAPEKCQLHTFGNFQSFDYNGLKGRLLSSSYMPLNSESGFNEMLQDLSDLFDKYKENNMVTIHYSTLVYAGKL